MTSLQKQLAAIAASSTNELDLKAQKASHSKSLLFEPGVAASQSFDSIYQLCFEGFEELCALDSRFIQFASTLFSPQSKSEERTQMTKKENKELDVALQKFLGLVGARLLLKPALKTVEWLVRRFRIHEYNTEHSILTFLPYHDTHLFPTLLSILPKELSPSFKFLHPYIAQLKSPPRAVIVHTSIHNHGFFTALNRYTLSVCKAHHQHVTLLSFWASIVTQAIDGKLGTSLSGRQTIQHQREEDLLTQLLPTLNEALSMRKCSELIVGCYMIITVLVSKASLGDTTLDAFMVAIVESWNSDTIESGLGCLAIVAERARSPRLPKPVFRATLRTDNIVERCISLSQQQPVRGLIMGLASNIVDRIDDQTSSDRLKTFMKILNSGLLEDVDRSKLVSWTISKIDRSLENGVVDANLLQGLRLDLQHQIEEGDVVPEPMDIEKINEGVVDPNIEDDREERLLEKNIEELEDTFSSAIQDNSFLTEEGAHIFDDIVAKASGLLISTESMNRLLSMSLFQGNHSQKARKQFSFVAQLWCTHRLSPNARSTALRTANERLSTLKTARDLESLVPLALVALADESSKVRKEAGRLFMALIAAVKSQTHESQNPHVVVLGNLYGRLQSTSANSSLRELQSLVDAITVPSLEECAVDPMAISQALRRELDSSVQQDPALSSQHGKQLKSDEKLAVYAWLCSYVNSMPFIEPKYQLLAILEKVTKVKGKPRSRYLLQSLKDWSEIDDSTAQKLSQRVGLDLQRLDAIFLAIVHPSDEEAVNYLLSLVSSKASRTRPSFQQNVLRRLRQLWTLLGVNRQQTIARSLFSLACPQKTPESDSKIVAQEGSVEFLKSVPIAAEILDSILEDVLDEFKEESPQPATKRRKIDMKSSEKDPGSNSNYEALLVRLTFILEMVEGSPAFNITLFHRLFRTLNEIQRRASQDPAHLSYPQSVTLSNLLSMVNNYEHKLPALDTTIIRPDVLVECVRAIDSPQARNTALLLLAKLAKYMPDTVLQSVMPIFTLMSESTAKQGDEFSTHVVDETVQEVIPLLAASLRQQNQDVVTSTAEIISSFAAVYDHIPSHRRLKLFKILASSLGAADSLFAVFITLVDRYLGKSEVVEFCILLMREFTSFEILTSLWKYIDLMAASFGSKSLHFQLLTQNNSSQEDIERTRSTLLSLVPPLLGDRVSQEQLRKDIRKDEANAIAIRDVYGKLLERTIVLAQLSSPLHNLRPSCARILECLLSILPFDQIIMAISPLLDNVDDDIRKSLIRSLQHQVSKEKEQRTEATRAATKFLPRLTQLLEHSNDIGLRVATVACIDKICEKFGKTNTDSVLDAAKAVVGCVQTDAEDPMLPSVSLYCLSSMIETLQNEFIPLLQPAIRSANECLRASLHVGKDAEKLHNSAYALLISVLENIPFMVSRDDLGVMMDNSYRSAARSFAPSCDETRKQFLRLVSSSVDIKLIFEVARATQPNAVKFGLSATQEHIDLLNSAVEIGRKSTINQNVRALLDVFLQELDLRRLANDGNDIAKFTEEEIDTLEQATIGALMSLTLKINDTSFRPFFVRFVEWAGEGLPKSNQGGQIARSRTLFNFLGSLSERLKSLVTMYFSYVLERTVELLEQTTDHSKESRALLSCVLQTLASGFKHDQDDFWQAPSRYSTILPPLVSQLSSVNSSNNAHTNFVHSYVIPAIVELAATASSPENHKQMNDSILKLLRTDNARVRLSAIKCQQELTKRVGDEWFAQLPAMLPVISELQENDDENVERETARWIKMIENVLGESLNSMLT